MINVKSLITRGLLVGACFTTAVTAGTVMNGAAQASTTHAASTVAMLKPALEAAGRLRPNWEQRTCSAFAKWQDKPTEARLERVMRDSTRAPWLDLSGDVWQWYGLEQAVRYDKPADKPGDAQRAEMAAEAVAHDCFSGE